MTVNGDAVVYLSRIQSMDLCKELLVKNRQLVGTNDHNYISKCHLDIGVGLSSTFERNTLEGQSI